MARRILLAEDNDNLALTLATLLQRKGYVVERAGDGAAALTAIVRTPPDLLVLDLRLPRLHGIELLRKLRQSPKTRDLAVIIISGVYKGEKYLQAAQALGVTHYLEKPFKTSALLEAVQQCSVPRAPVPERPSLAELLCNAYRDKFTGRCRVQGKGEEHTIDFIQGLPVSVLPGFTVADFGTFLHRRGLLSEQEYAYYLHEGGLRSEALVQMGCLDYPSLLQEKLAFLTAELVSACRPGPISAELLPFDIPDGLQVITVNVPRIIHEACRSWSREELELLLRPRLDHYVAVAPDFFRHINFLRLDPRELAQVDLLNGQQRLAPLLAAESSAPAALAAMSLLGMLQFGPQPLLPANAAEMPLRTLFNTRGDEPAELDEGLENFADMVEEDAGPPAGLAPQAQPVEQSTPDGTIAEEVRALHSTLQGKNHYEVFGLDSGSFSFDRLKERYFALTRRFGPEVLMELGGAEAELVQDILATVASAYNTLSDVVKKERYDELLGSDRIGLGEQGDELFQASVQFQSGQVFLEMGEWDNAEKALQDACNIDPNNGVYLASLAWAIYRNPAYRNSRAMMDKARQMLGKALSLERTAEGYAYRGWMHLDAGQDLLAEAEFNKALKLDARLLSARQGMRQILEKREQDKKGLFRKMFR